MKPDGIYFDLPFEEYIAEERIGSTDLCNLRISPATFWRGSWLDPNPEQLTPDQEKRRMLARFLGTAYHTARFEPDRFDDLYAREISPADMGKKALMNGSAIEAELVKREQPKTKSGESVLQKAQRLVDAGYEGEIWHIAKAEWEASLGERMAIAEPYYSQIIEDMKRIEASPVVQYLRGGASEVSVFWHDEAGRPLRARFDYLKPDLFVDFKTFENFNGKHFNQAILDAFRYNRYYLQAALYWKAAEAIRLDGLEIQGEASDAQRELIAQIAINPHRMRCVYVWQEKKGVPNILARHVRLHHVPINALANGGFGSESDMPDEMREKFLEPTDLKRLADWEIRAALRDFDAYSALYDNGEPWLPYEPEGEITDDDFPPYFLDPTA